MSATVAGILQEVLVRRDAALSLPSTRAQPVTLQCTSDIHVDDDVLSPSPVKRTVDFQLSASRLTR